MMYEYVRCDLTVNLHVNYIIHLNLSNGTI